MKTIDKSIRSLVFPAIASNVTVPLVGIVDTMIVGHLGDANFIGAVAVGSMCFSIIYWLFGFLRMGTSGMTAQSYGADDPSAQMANLLRSLMVASGIGILLILGHPWLVDALIRLMDVSGRLQDATRIYLTILIWGLPAMLCQCSVVGWLIGMQNTRATLIVTLSQNLTNVGLALLFVYGIDAGLRGVAFAAMLAQWLSLLTAFLCYALSYHRRLRPYFRSVKLWSENAFSRYFSVNGFLFLRTFCLVAVSQYFVRTGAGLGVDILSGNAILMQFFLFFSYCMDGLAYAGEALSGKAVGAHDYPLFRRVVVRLFYWAGISVLAFTLAYALGGETILSLMTDLPSVRKTASRYLFWTLIIPVAGAAAFIWDGIFVGMTASSGMFVSSFIATIAFFLLEYVLIAPWGNHGLWTAFIVYLALRGGVATVWYLARLRGRVFQSSPHGG